MYMCVCMWVTDKYDLWHVVVMLYMHIAQLFKDSKCYFLFSSRSIFNH